MGDYFDDDDLINDYMEEDEHEGPPEEMMEEAYFMEEDDEEDQLAVEGPNTSTTTVQPEEGEAEEVFMATPNEIIAAPRTKQDLYSFERYSGNMEWRKKTKSEEDVFTATQWKRRNVETVAAPSSFQQSKEGPMGAARPHKKATELVDFWNARTPHAEIIIAPSASVSLVPTEGSESITLQNGTRIHVRPATSEVNLDHEDRGDILGISMTVLMAKSDKIMRTSEHSKVRRSQQNISNKAESQNVAPKNRRTEDCEHQLWVDKHAPSSFSHLLSDERTNREVLRALRAWDPYVFNKEAPKRANPNQDEVNASTSENKHDTRPDERNRVLLLSGPPGVGKTTLAHIIARHAGYRPLEVNASDERSATILKERVVRAMESATLNLPLKSGNADELAGRPNCLILDEIDGADAKASIGALVDIIRADIPTKESKKKSVHLRRPIIFICNHKYAPALRPLLPYAQQFDVSSPSENRLVARLRNVLMEERLSVFGGSSMLHQLVTSTGGDIRSCLYTLQFASARARELAARKAEHSSIVDISSTLKSSLKGNGMKDARNDVAGTVTAIFRKTKAKQGAARPDTMTSVLQIVEGFGENSKTIDCLFTNLNQVSYVDPTLDRSVVAHEWLSGADIYRSQKIAVASLNHAEHYAMQRYYMPSAAAAIHLLCRVETRAELTFSTKVMFENSYGREAKWSLVNKFVEGLSPKARVNLTSGTAVSEVIPFALWMLSAGTASNSLSRPVSSIDILNRAERLSFASHIATLRALGLTYVAESNPAGSFNSAALDVEMRLEPAIDTLSKFGGFKVPVDQQRRSIPSSIKELLAHQAHLEGMRLREQKSPPKEATVSLKSPLPKENRPPPLLSPADRKREIPLKKTTVHEPVPKPALKPPSEVKNFLVIGAVKAKTAKSKRKAALVGFDRSKKFKKSNSGSGVPFNQIVRFKYQKGFTQAVRTCCRMEDLM